MFRRLPVWTGCLKKKMDSDKNCRLIHKTFLFFFQFFDETWWNCRTTWKKFIKFAFNKKVFYIAHFLCLSTVSFLDTPLFALLHSRRRKQKVARHGNWRCGTNVFKAQAFKIQKIYFSNSELHCKWQEKKSVFYNYNCLEYIKKILSKLWFSHFVTSHFHYRDKFDPI